MYKDIILVDKIVTVFAFVKVSSRLDNGKLGIRIEVQYQNKCYFEAELIDGKPVILVGERDEFPKCLEDWINLF